MILSKRYHCTIMSMKMPMARGVRMRLREVFSNSLGGIAPSLANKKAMTKGGLPNFASLRRREFPK
jgi:hypothetical protein